MRSIAKPVSEARFRGSNERIIGNDGHINAGSNAEVLTRLLEVANMISAGELSPASEGEVASREERQNSLRQAFHSETSDWAELGSAIAYDIDSRLEREGFMRTILQRGDVADNTVARVRVRERNVNGVVSSGVTQVYPQYIRDKYIFVDEFYITAQPRIEELDLHQGSGDLLEDKYFEGLEAIMVQEDRTVTKMLRNTAGLYNDMTYFSGQFSQSVFQAVKQNVDEWAIPATTAIMSIDLLSEINAGTNFSTWFDPITKWEIVRTGRLGHLLGLTLLTDGYRDPKMKVLDRGEFIITGAPEYLGGYTDRGPVVSRPVDEFDKFVPARGWTMHEIIGMAVANGKAVAMGKRQ